MASIPTIDEIKQKLGIDPADPSQDAAIERMQEAVIAIIEGYLGRGLAYAQEVQEFDPITSGDAVLFLHRYPVESITSVSLDDQPIAAGTWRVFKSTGQLRPLYGAGWGYDYRCRARDVTIAVDYAGGYADDEWPPAIADAIDGYFQWKWKAAGSGNADDAAMNGPVKSSSVDGLSITYGDIAGGSSHTLQTTTIPAGLEPWAAQLSPFMRYRAPGA